MLKNKMGAKSASGVPWILFWISHLLPCKHQHLYAYVACSHGSIWNGMFVVWALFNHS